MARAERDAEKALVWRGALAGHAASGQSVRTYCQREGLSQSSLYAWRRRIGERDGESAKAPAFVPVVVTDPAPGGPSIAIDLAGGRVLRLPASTSLAWLAELVLTLEARAPGKELGR